MMIVTIHGRDEIFDPELKFFSFMVLSTFDISLGLEDLRFDEG